MSDIFDQQLTFSEEYNQFRDLTEKVSGKPIVVKVGGEILLHPDLAKSLVTDLIFLRSLGAHPILCHGGGPQLSKRMKAEGVTPRFVHGHRVTDEQVIEITASVFLGDLNRSLVALLNSVAPIAIGLSGIDAHLLRVTQRDPELGFVGDVEQVKSTLLTQLFSEGHIPIIAPLGVDPKGSVYNVNADMVASHIASSIQAEALILTTNVDGILEDKDDPKTLISTISARDLPELFSKGVISEGMLPKTDAASLAISDGVKEVLIVNGFTPHVILQGLSQKYQIGTAIHATTGSSDD